MYSWFVPANRLYDIESRTPIAHPAHQATDADVRRALENREVRADGGYSSSDIDQSPSSSPSVLIVLESHLRIYLLKYCPST